MWFMLAQMVFAAMEPPERVVPGETWATKTPEEVGLDRAALDLFAEYVGGRGCVVRYGYMVYSWGDAAERGDVASAAKPWYAHFLLKAVEDGKIGSVDDPAVRFEPRLNEINPNLNHKDAKIAWRHFANQTSCYGVTEPPGTAYCYNDWQMALFWDTLFLNVYGATRENVDETVVHPLLTDALQCEDDPTFMAFGVKERPGRVGVSPRDFARFGLLYLNGGNWRGRQLLRRDLAAMAVSEPLSNAIPQSAGEAAAMIDGQRSIGSRNVPDNQTDHYGSYSWLWWTNGIDRQGIRHWEDAPDDAYAASGHGGKRFMGVVPSLDLIVSWNDSGVQSWEMTNEAWRRLVASFLAK